MCHFAASFDGRQVGVVSYVAKRIQSASRNINPASTEVVRIPSNAVVGPFFDPQSRTKRCCRPRQQWAFRPCSIRRNHISCDGGPIAAAKTFRQHSLFHLITIHPFKLKKKASCLQIVQKDRRRKYFEKYKSAVDDVDGKGTRISRIVRLYFTSLFAHCARKYYGVLRIIFSLFCAGTAGTTFSAHHSIVHRRIKTRLQHVLISIGICSS